MKKKKSNKDSDIIISTVKTRKFKSTLKIFYPQEKIDQARDELASKIIDLKQRKLDKTEMVKGFDADTAKIEAEISSLATLINNKYMFGMVDCVVVYNFTDKKKYYTRTDTKEMYLVENMTQEELQGSIEDIIGGNINE